MKAGAHFAEVEAALRSELGTDELRLVEVLRDKAAAQDMKDAAYATLLERLPASLGALVVAFVPVLEVVARRRGPEDVLSEFCELVAAGVGRREIKGKLLNALRRRKQPTQPEPTVEPDFAALLDVHEAVQSGAIAEDEFDLLQAYWLYDKTIPELANECRVSTDAMKKRIQRTTRALRLKLGTTASSRASEEADGGSRSRP